MRRGAGLRALFAAHSAAGIGLGLIVYLVCLSGSAALFVGELRAWSEPALRTAAPPRPLSPERLLAPIAADLAEGAPPLVVVDPDWHATAGEVLWRRPGDEANQRMRVHHDGGQPVSATRADLPGFLQALHTDLLAPKPWGRYLVGLCGMMMLLSVASGILMHRKPLRQAFTLRLQRSALLGYSDWHKLMGLWALPFHAVLAYTGALLGLAGLLIALSGSAAFGGDTRAARAAFEGSIPPSPTGEPAAPPPLDRLARDAGARFPGHGLARIVVWHYGDAAATVRVDLHDPGTLSTQDTRLVYQAPWRAPREVMALEQGVGRRAFAAVVPLHYGNYGGLWLKWIYAVLGVTGALLAASGTLIWFERRNGRQGGHQGRRARPRAEGGVAGAFVGLPLGLLVLLPLTALGVLPQGGYAMFAAVALAVWGAGAGAGACLGPRVLPAGVAGLGVAGALVPLANAIGTDAPLWQTLPDGDWGVAGVDLFGLAVAALAVGVHWRWRP